MSNGAVAVRSSSPASTIICCVLHLCISSLSASVAWAAARAWNPSLAPPHPRHGSMVLFPDSLPILHLPADDGRPWASWSPLRAVAWVSLPSMVIAPRPRYTHTRQRAAGDGHTPMRRVQCRGYMHLRTAGAHCSRADPPRHRPQEGVTWTRTPLISTSTKKWPRGRWGRESMTSSREGPPTRSPSAAPGRCSMPSCCGRA